MKHCLFTICAKNYIGLAQLLGQSIAKYNYNVDFYIVVADEIDKVTTHIDDPYILIAKDILSIDEALWNNMTFKYNSTL